MGKDDPKSFKFSAFLEFFEHSANEQEREPVSSQNC